LIQHGAESASFGKTSFLTASTRGDILDFSVTLSETAFTGSAHRLAPTGGSLKSNCKLLFLIIDLIYSKLNLIVP